MTFDDKQRSIGGFASGFDYLRLSLAVLVMFGHSFIITGSGRLMTEVMPFGLAALRGYAILPVFFALSGYLVAASLLRSKTLGIFLGLRALRIMPALAVEIALSALILGPLLTDVSLREYFTSSEFYRYFLNIVGYIHYHLPGLFMNNPVKNWVNGSLWTVPFEAECYILLAALAAFGLARRPWLFAVAVVGFTAMLFIYDQYTVRDTSLIVAAGSTATGKQLVLFFLGGVSFYLLRDRMPYSLPLFILAAVLSAIMVTSHTLIYLAPFPVAYLTAYIGLLQPKRLPVIFSGDYSYGIYLYAYPVQQSVYQLAPAGRDWSGNFLISLLVVCLFAAFSWHAVEKQMLHFKRLLLGRPDATVRPPVPASVTLAQTRPDAAEG